MADALAREGQDLTPIKRFSGSGVGGMVTLTVIRLGSAALGSYSLDRPFAIVQPAQGVFADPSVPGFVANYTLDRFGRVVFDYIGSVLVVDDRKEPG